MSGAANSLVRKAIKAAVLPAGPAFRRRRDDVVILTYHAIGESSREVDLMDGIKVFDERGWAQVLPDPDEPLIHIYAEGVDEPATAELESELRELVEEILQGAEAPART